MHSNAQFIRKQALIIVDVLWESIKLTSDSLYVSGMKSSKFLVMNGCFCASVTVYLSMGSYWDSFSIKF
jgi:hypothetical protein